LIFAKSLLRFCCSLFEKSSLFSIIFANIYTDWYYSACFHFIWYFWRTYSVNLLGISLMLIELLCFDFYVCIIHAFVFHCGPLWLDFMYQLPKRPKFHFASLSSNGNMIVVCSFFIVFILHTTKRGCCRYFCLSVFRTSLAICILRFVIFDSMTVVVGYWWWSSRLILIMNWFGLSVLIKFHFAFSKNKKT
jgi:hypothetical protein